MEDEGTEDVTELPLLYIQFAHLIFHFAFRGFSLKKLLIKNNPEM